MLTNEGCAYKDQGYVPSLYLHLDGRDKLLWSVVTVAGAGSGSAGRGVGPPRDRSVAKLPRLSYPKTNYRH